jgi:uncharacterized protein
LIQPWIAIAGLIVGFVVGMTGMGGGALMTPILVLVFGVQPLAAVSSDLVASFVMKPVGSLVHIRKRTVNWDLVRWLMVGSIPAAFSGVLVLRALGRGLALQQDVQLALGGALCLAAGAIIIRDLLERRRAGEVEGPLRVRRLPTIAIGALGGLIVGITSVGSGSLIIALLLVLYPTLQGRRLVGTDLVQAVPLVGAAALAHVLFGDFRMALTLSLLVGSIPGVYLGARLSSSVPDTVIKPVLFVVLLASALKLLGAGNLTVGVIVLALAAVLTPYYLLRSRSEGLVPAVEPGPS